MSESKNLRIKLVRSPIGSKEAHKATARALGLRRVGQETVKPDSPEIRGMAESISFMVEVSEEFED